MSELPRVALIITGGTIDSIGKDRLDLAWYIEAGGPNTRGVEEQRTANLHRAAVFV